MKHLFVPYELALLAKEKGFDDECLAWYYKLKERPELNSFQLFEKDYFLDKSIICTNSSFGNGYMITAPLYQQLIDWFLMKHDMWIEILLFDRGFLEENKFCFQWRVYNKSEEWFTSADECKTPIETMNLAFKKAFKLI